MMKCNYKRLISAIMSATLLFGSMPVFGGVAVSPVTITVGKDGNADYKSIQEAVNSIKDTPTERNRAVIMINPGIYNEAVVVDKPYVTFQNTSQKDDVVITYDKANGHSDPSKNFGTDKTATVIVDDTATGFTAKNITFVNSYNIDEPDNDVRKQVQAVALETLADKVVLNECNFIGRQDTLYLKGASKGQQFYGEANPARVYLKNCYIEGTVDYIFGDATAFFDNCKLFMAYYKNGGHFTAPNTTLFNIGYVFNNCQLSVDEKYTADMADKIDLGRPWQCDGAYPNYGSNSVFINCTLPDIMNEKGFKLWDDTTVVNKVRFMEYGSKTSKGKAVDLSKRDSFVKVLTSEQAEAYSAYNVLKGNDNWDPSKSFGMSAPCDVTLNSYSVSVPVGETFELKAFNVPSDSRTTFEYTSADDSVASIDKNGVISAKKMGTTVISVKNSRGLTTKADVSVTAPRTAVPKVKSIALTNESKLIVGQKLIANYSYVLDSDNTIDAAKLRWYAVKDNQKIVLKEGVGEYYGAYTVMPEDIGYNIMLEIHPATTTTYGVYGAPQTYTTASIVQPKGTEGGAVYRTDFANINDWTTEGKWNTVTRYNNVFNTADCDESTSFMKYANGADWDNITLKGRFRFNPDKKGLGSEGFYNIYMNYSEDGKSYYVLKMARGGNTKSILLYLYKCVNGVETLIASDEKSLKNKIYQNSGEDNPYFSVELSKDNDRIEMSFFIEGTAKSLATLNAKDSAPLGKGTIAFEAGGDSDVIYMDSISVTSNSKIADNGKTKIYLLGDSTAVSYGDDNSIGGWGEYLVNYFDKDVEIINKAEGGRSTRSFLNQGRLKEVTNQVGPGDYVFVQFGTNDQRTDESAFTEHAVQLGEPDEKGVYPTIPAEKTKTPDSIYNFYKNSYYPYEETYYPYESGSFKWYMSQYISAIESTGATPVLLTPMCRLFFDAQGKITPHFGENDGYIESIRQLAKEKNIVCIDMYDITKGLYESYGVMTTQGLHNIKADGTIDLTHYNKFGANLVASKTADAIKSSVLTVRKSIISSSLSVGRTDALRSANLYVVGTNGAVGLDNTNMAVNSDGFGNYIQKYISEKIAVKNLAVPDQSIKSYISTPQYQEFINSIKEGDYVLFNFGGNEAEFKKDAKMYSYPKGDENSKNSFSYYFYNNYIKAAKDKKAVVIITTPVAERNFVNGSYAPVENPYIEAVADMARKYAVSYANLNTVTADIYNTMGEEGSKVLNAYDREKGILSDSLSSFGAELTAKKFLEMMQQSSASFKDYINAEALKTNKPMTRADFVYMIMQAIGENGKANTNFNDVINGKYYEYALGRAKTLGIVTAVTGNRFMPEEPLTGDFATDFVRKIMNYKKSDADLSDVYKLLNGDISPEIGIWAVDRIYEELN